MCSRVAALHIVRRVADPRPGAIFRVGSGCLFEGWIRIRVFVLGLDPYPGVFLDRIRVHFFDGLDPVFFLDGRIGFFS